MLAIVNVRVFVFCLRLIRLIARLREKRFCGGSLLKQFDAVSAEVT